MINDTVDKYLGEGKITSMTFGVMPEFRDFQKNFKKSVGNKLYPWELKGEDARAVQKIGVDSYGEFTDKELYDIVKKLNKQYDKGDDDAGSLASAIMSTLDFEWI